MGRKLEKYLAEGESVASEVSRKSNCLDKMKCSSRAEKDGNQFDSNFASELVDGVIDLEWVDFEMDKNQVSTNPFRSKPASALHLPQQTIPVESEEVPFDDETKVGKVVDLVALEGIPNDDFTRENSHSITRILSTDTHDTIDTAPVSNLDPNRSPAHPLSPNASKLNIDAFCSKYFNTPAGQNMHSSGALGDHISPVESPIDEEDWEDEDEGTSKSRSADPSTFQQDAKKMLEIPRMGVQIVRTESEASSLLGDSLFEEKKAGDDQNETSLFLNPDTARMKIGSAEVNASSPSPERAKARALVRPSQSAAHRDSIVSETSTHSSISNFTAMRSKSPLSFEEKARPLTPHPFFWRTFPNVTVTSDNFQTQKYRRKDSSMPPRIIKDRAAHMAALASVRVAVEEHKRQNSKHLMNPEEIMSAAECSPFLDQEVLKKLWMESCRSADDATGQHRRQLVPSIPSVRLAGVFRRGQDYQKPDAEQLNFVMG